MSELKDHLYFLLADNIDYNSAFDVFMVKDSFENISSWMNETDKSIASDEDFFIDVLAGTDIPFLIYGACFNLAIIGTQYALPALLFKEEAEIPHTQAEIRNAIDRIQARAGITAEQMSVLKDPQFKRVRWNKNALTFLCVFSVIIISLEMDMEDKYTEALGDFLISELGVDMGGFISISDFRMCHEETDAYFNEMSQYDKLWRSEIAVTDILRGSDIEESQESKLKEFYTELMNEYLNIQVVKTFVNNF
ncbi:MAG: hypothetical protein V4456_14255 [Bacteroidota bacterium]|uniref:hypothetical protein n=1 Tax=Mucilaginibacter inviolabilis TaxID=2714892 RepID=UPI001409A352|nr:hypothetical protein [Mucilaginibacter inviolabilis]NHA05840.1 hypothetical protein [Mucilaginibacter inviolabilis]